MADTRDRTLTVVRHAKSSWRYELDDHARPLNKRGLRDCQRIPPLLKGRIEVPGLVLCSDAARTVQTCQVIADALGLSTESTRIDHRLYLADLETLLDLVGEVDPSINHVMVIGHNPGLTDLVNHLCPGHLDNLPTFGVAVLRLDGVKWNGLREGSASPVDLILPKNV